MTPKQAYLLKIIQKLTHRNGLMTIKRIWYHIEMQAGREIDKGQIVVTLAELIEMGLVQKEVRMASDHVDQEKIETPFFYAF